VKGPGTHPEPNRTLGRVTRSHSTVSDNPPRRSPVKAPGNLYYPPSTPFPDTGRQEGQALGNHVPTQTFGSPASSPAPDPRIPRWRIRVTSPATSRRALTALRHPITRVLPLSVSRITQRFGSQATMQPQRAQDSIIPPVTAPATFAEHSPSPRTQYWAPYSRLGPCALRPPISRGLPLSHASMSARPKSSP
jgi:hypothetical protein